MAFASRMVTICNKKGLHARAAAKFVKLVAEYGHKVIVTKLGREGEPEPEDLSECTALGSSILGLMMLAAEPGIRLKIEAEGEQAEVVLQAIADLIADRFGEGE